MPSDTDFLQKITLQVPPNKSQFRINSKDARFQIIPELDYERDEYWLPLHSNHQVRCDIRTLSEGNNACIDFKNDSDEDLRIPLHVIMTVKDDDAEHAGDIWHKSTISGSVKRRIIFEATPYSVVDFFQRSTAFTTFKDFSEPPIITHTKTFLTLQTIQTCIDDTQMPSKVFSYVGVDTGENLLAVLKFLKQEKEDRFKLNIIWNTSWDRTYSNEVVDRIRLLLGETFSKQIAFTANKQNQNIVYDSPSEMRADIMILTYVLPWMENQHEEMLPYLRTELKSDSRVVVVNPSGPEYLTRGQNFTHQFEITLPDYLKRIEKPNFHDITCCRCTVFNFKHHHLRPHTKFEEKEFSYSEEVTLPIPAFDKQAKAGTRQNLDGYLERLSIGLEYTHDVFLVDGETFHANTGMDDFLSGIDRVKPTNLNTNRHCAHLYPGFTILDHIDTVKRRNLMFVVYNAEHLSNHDQKTIANLFIENSRRTHVIFTKREWSFSDVQTPPPNEEYSFDFEHHFTEQALVWVIEHLLNPMDSPPFPWKAPNQLPDMAHELALVGRDDSARVFCYSWKYIFDAIKHAKNLHGLSDGFKLRDNKQNYRIFTQDEYDEIVRIRRRSEGHA